MLPLDDGHNMAWIPLQNGELMTKRTIFQSQIALRAKTLSKKAYQESQQAELSTSFTRWRARFGIRFIYLI